MLQTIRVPHIVVAAFLSMATAACASEVEETMAQAEGLTAHCVDSPETLPAGAWLCPNELVVECEAGVGTPDAIYASFAEGGLLCDGRPLALSDRGPFPLGNHTVSVEAPASDAGVGGLCVASLAVVDSASPVVRGRSIELWPPNHAMHTFTPSDCADVVDRCDAEVDVFFTYVESDEPHEAIGDGNHEPDVIVHNCRSVALRAERIGPENGRVYRLGVRAVDGSGNAADAECVVSVPHDQSGRPAIDDGMAYHIEMSEHC